VFVTIARKHYYVSINEQFQVVVAPKTSGDQAISTTGYDSYAYINGGSTYRQAVVLAHEIDELLNLAEKRDKQYNEFLKQAYC